MTTRPSDQPPSVIETCGGCQAGLIKRKEWDALGAEGRQRAREWGFDRKDRDNCCQRCIQSDFGKTARAHTATREAIRTERLEDVLWMGECGESLGGAAARLGLTEGALDKFMRREGMDDLLARMTLRNPRDPNSVNAAAYESRLQHRKAVA